MITWICISGAKACCGQTLWGHRGYLMSPQLCPTSGSLCVPTRTTTLPCPTAGFFLEILIRVPMMALTGWYHHLKEKSFQNTIPYSISNPISMFPIRFEAVRRQVFSVSRLSYTLLRSTINLLLRTEWHMEAEPDVFKHILNRTRSDTAEVNSQHQVANGPVLPPKKKKTIQVGRGHHFVSFKQQTDLVLFNMVTLWVL